MLTVPKCNHPFCPEDKVRGWGVEIAALISYTARQSLYSFAERIISAGWNKKEALKGTHSKIQVIHTSKTVKYYILSTSKLSNIVTNLQ